MQDAVGEPLIREIRHAGEWEQVLAVRRAVFVDEQGGPPEDEPDARDAEARHFIVLVDGAPAGTARVLDEGAGSLRLGRIALLPQHRGRGWGRRLLERLIGHCRARGAGAVVLSAQVQAAGFYLRRGFVPEGEPYVEAGILHQRMRLNLKA